jgi:F0F1-type ATP synthase epsilon subunit
MAKAFHLTVARVGENLFDGEALSVSAAGEEGALEVLAGHEALVSPLKAGELRVVAGNGEKYHFEMPHGGILEVSGGQATVLL